jgi:hypothetical protein
LIIPDRYTNLQTCVLNVGAMLLSMLKEHGELRLEEMGTMIAGELGDASSHNLLPAVLLLFSLGAVGLDEATGGLTLLDGGIA